MRIKYTGSTLVNRTVNGHTWNRANGHVVNIEDSGLAADLLTSGTREFALSATEPLLQWLNEEQVLVLLVEFNGSTAQDLVGLPKDKATAEKFKLSAKALREIQAAVTSCLESNDPIATVEEKPVVIKSG